MGRGFQVAIGSVARGLDPSGHYMAGRHHGSTTRHGDGFSQWCAGGAAWVLWVVEGMSFFCKKKHAQFFMGKSTTNDCKLACSMAMLVYQRVMSYLLVLSEEWRNWNDYWWFLWIISPVPTKHQWVFAFTLGEKLRKAPVYHGDIVYSS